MALSMEEQRILAEIERQLADDDPSLAVRLSTFRRPGLTAERFVACPYGTGTAGADGRGGGTGGSGRGGGVRMYRTGDLARWAAGVRGDGSPRWKPPGCRGRSRWRSCSCRR